MRTWHCICRSVAVIAVVMTASSAWAGCPELNRYPVNLGNGELSISGGASPYGARAADDFFLPTGNGNAYNVRIVRFVMLANFTLTPTNVGITVFNDGTSPPLAPVRRIPGTVASGPPNSAPTITNLGLVGFSASDGRPFRAYEVSYLIPAGFLQLPANRWYWISPYALGTSATPGATDVAYATISTVGVSPATIIGEVINRSAGTPPTGGNFTTWTQTSTCCLGGSYDLGVYIDCVQVARPISDITCDFLSTIDDLFFYIGAYFAGSGSADFDGRNGTTIDDLFLYFNAWFAGL